jgi:hypothetical protein
MCLFPFRLIVGVTLFCAIFGPPLAAQTAPANPIRRIYGFIELLCNEDREILRYVT